MASDLHTLPPLVEPPVEDHELVPPQDLAAERAVLGGMLTSRTAVEECVEALTGRDFYRPAHEAIFDACLALFVRNEPVDQITVADHMGDGLRRVGGSSYLFDLVSACVTAANAGHYAEIVSDRAVERRLVEAGTAITQLGFSRSAGSDVGEVVAQAGRFLDAVTVPRRDESSHEADVYAAVDALDDPPGVPTPWQGLTDVIGGWSPGHLYLIGARPATGKTLLGVGAALYMAWRGKRSLICSLEMSKTEIYHRMLSSVGSVDSAQIAHRRVPASAYPRISEAAAKIAKLPLTIDDRSTLRPIDVRAAARKLCRDGLGLVVVDYLQLMASDGRVESRQVAVAEFSRQLKVMARELDVPIIALSQLNRGTESRADRRPTISDLRDSGALEQDADVVLLLHRDVDNTPDELQVHVGKNRHGSADVTVKLRWEAHFSRVVDQSWSPSAAAV